MSCDNTFISIGENCCQVKFRTLFLPESNNLLNLYQLQSFLANNVNTGIATHVKQGKVLKYESNICQCFQKHWNSRFSWSIFMASFSLSSIMKAHSIVTLISLGSRYLKINNTRTNSIFETVFKIICWNEPFWFPPLVYQVFLLT